MICMACVASSEGLRQYAYRDVGGVWTICYGETKNIQKGDTATIAQCKEMLGARIERDFGPQVDKCVKGPIPPARKAALTSFAYNVGAGAMCRSSVVRKLNAGDVRGGCDALLLYDKAGGKKVPGLLSRRKKERELCLAS